MTRGCSIALLVAAGLAGVAIAVAVVAAISFRGVAPRSELTAAEKSLLVQVDDLVAFGIVPRTGRTTESFRAKRNVDGSLELEYAYRGEDATPPFSLKSEAEVCETDVSAADSLAARVSAYRLGFRLAGEKGTELCDQPAPAGVGAGTSGRSARTAGQSAAPW